MASILQNKDIAGAIGTLGGSTIFISRSEDIKNLFYALYEHLGLIDKALMSATNISTDVTIILGSAIASYLVSRFVPHKLKKKEDTPEEV